MAYLELIDGKKQAISGKAGLFLWKSLNDMSGLDDEQLDRLKKIKSVWLAWREAPDDYVEANLKGIIPMALNDWLVDRRTGKPTRPSDDFSWKFAKRWGLWVDGRPSILVTDPARPTQTSMARHLKVNNR